MAKDIFILVGRILLLIIEVGLLFWGVVSIIKLLCM